MNERHKELLSAFLDGELDAAELDELSLAVTGDDSLVELAARYQGVGEALRDPAMAPQMSAPPGILHRVRAAVDAEPAIDAPPLPAVALSAGDSQAGESRNVVTLDSARRRRQLPRPLVGAGIAAAIAIAAIGALRLYGDAGVGEGDVAPTVAQLAVPQSGAQSQPGAQSASPADAAGDGIRWTVSQPAVERRLTQYLVNHSELSRGGVHGILPYARVVGYRETRPRQ